MAGRKSEHKSKICIVNNTNGLHGLEIESLSDERGIPFKGPPSTDNY